MLAHFLFVLMDAFSEEGKWVSLEGFCLTTKGQLEPDKPLFQADGVGSVLFQTEPGMKEGSYSQFYPNTT